MLDKYKLLQYLSLLGGNIAYYAPLAHLSFGPSRTFSVHLITAYLDSKEGSFASWNLVVEQSLATT